MILRQNRFTNYLHLQPLLGTCFVLIAAAMICIGTVVLIQHFGGTVPYWIPLISMIIAVGGYAAGPSPIPFIVLSEMFNFQVNILQNQSTLIYTDENKPWSLWLEYLHWQFFHLFLLTSKLKSIKLYLFQIRAKLMGCIVCYTWFINFIQLFIFAPISNGLGLYTAFYLYAGINILAVFISLVVLPEAKGKSVEAIEEILKKKYKLTD